MIVTSFNWAGKKLHSLQRRDFCVVNDSAVKEGREIDALEEDTAMGPRMPRPHPCHQGSSC